MAVDFRHYHGREPAYVKHTFLDKYLPALFGRVSKSFDEVVYLDGFAGPWKSKAGEAFEDTSFGIALAHMTAIREQYRRLNRNVRMRAILVEKDEVAYSQLAAIQKQFPLIEIHPLNGEFEKLTGEILQIAGKNSFLFALIDPKGFPNITKIMPIIARENTEVLVNFMFDHANRFAGIGLIKRLDEWLSDDGWQGSETSFGELSGGEREAEFERRAVYKLKSAGRFKFAPVISVDKSTKDRTLYKLIYLTRHPAGLEVFRNCESKTLEAQAEARTESKARERAEKARMDDLFGLAPNDITGDRSAKKIEQGVQDAVAKLLAQLAAAGPYGKRWSEIWPEILATTVISKSKLGMLANDARKDGRIEAPGWPSPKHRQPGEAQILRLPHP